MSDPARTLDPVYIDGTVRSCNTCPFSLLRRSAANPFYCLHPKWGDGEDGTDPPKVSPLGNDRVPFWCPLREGPALVRLAGDVPP